MTIDTLIYFILLALIAEVLGTVGGFGSSLFFVPIAGYFFDLHSVLGITALFHVMSNLSKIAFFRKGVDKKLVLTIGIPAVIFVVAGAFLSKFLETGVLQIILAGFLIVLSLFFLIFKSAVVPPTTTNSIGGGILSGFAAGLLGTGGAIRGITMAAFNLSTHAFIATSAIIDLAIDVSRSVVYAANGYVHYHDLYLVPVLLAVSIAGTYIGKRILSRISQGQFKTIALVLILITGLSGLYKFLMR